MEIHELLRGRKSTRAIDPDKPVDQETLDALVEAFRWAPSSFNKQPWRLVVVKDKEIQKALHESMSDWNKQWIPKAPVLIVVVGNPEEQDHPDGRPQYLFDCGMGVENMLLQGCAMGLTIHASVGWKEDDIKKAIDIPDPYRAVAMIAVGRPGRTEDLPESLQKAETAPRSRKETDEILFTDRFGNTSA